MALTRSFHRVTFSPIQTFLRPTALCSHTLHSSLFMPTPDSNQRPNIEQAFEDMKTSLGHHTSSTDLDPDSSQIHNAHVIAHQTMQDLHLTKTTVHYSANSARSSADPSQDLYVKTTIAIQKLKNTFSTTFEDDITLSVQREVSRSLKASKETALPTGIENMVRTMSNEPKRSESEGEAAIMVKQRVLLADDDVEGSAETAVAAFWKEKVASSEEGYKINRIDVDAGNEERPAGFTDLYKDRK